MSNRVLVVAAIVMLVLVACGDDTSSTTVTTSDTAAQTSSSSSSSSSSATTTSTTTTTMATTTTPAGEFVRYEDPVDDCLNATTNASAPTCMPEAIDILSVEITRASLLTIVLEIAEPGLPGLPDTYQITLGLDLDLDPGTGIVDFWPEFHGIGPDLETDFFGGPEDFFVQAYSIEGQNEFILLDPPPVEWTWLDETHVQVVFEMESVGDGPFAIAGDLTTGNYYDHFVDNGHLLFPSGDVVLVGP